MFAYVHVAIDGLAASGKSTIGARLAQRLGFLFVDSGLLYRAVTAVALTTNISLDAEKELSKLTRQCKFEIVPEAYGPNPRPKILADGIDVTPLLRTESVDQLTPSVASLPSVRSAIIDQLRAIASGRDVVMAGRDIGTAVLPNAVLKIFLEVPLAVRAQRRLADIVAGRHIHSLSPQGVRAELARRDEQDATQSTKAADAVTVSNDGESIDLVVTEIMNMLPPDVVAFHLTKKM